MNKGEDLRELDFRFPIGDLFNGRRSSPRRSVVIDKLRNALALGTSPIVRGQAAITRGRCARSADSVTTRIGLAGNGGRRKHPADVEPH